jgi:EAL domain-containing protein (putative c-di-GMP-specific phosphodiesterase class I)
MTESIKVLIVDDHAMLAESLNRLLSHDPQIHVVGVANTIGDGLALARTTEPHVVLMDFHLPDGDGAGATVRLRAEHPEVRVILLTGSESPAFRWQAARAGAAAWMRKTQAVHDLIEWVHRVHRGERFVDDDDVELPRIEDLVVHYQPIVDLTSELVVGFEALVRWQHPERGLLAPGHFLPLAEETGFIVDIDRRVRELALTQLGTWQRQLAGRPLFVSVNLSAREFDEPDLEMGLRATLAGIDADAAGLVLEVTETMVLRDEESTIGRFEELKKLGFGLALDDFGTAFSSLSYLRQFPFDHIKIDTSFTAELPDVARSVVLVEAIQRLAATVGLRSIAEGIERPEQASCLRELGWGFGQGYLYSKPVDAGQADALLHGVLAMGTVGAVSAPTIARSRR